MCGPYHPDMLRNPLLTFCPRHFARSVQQIEDLQNDKKDLLAALKSLVDRPDFEVERHPDIPGLIEKMSERPSESSQSLHSTSQDQSKSSSRSLATEDSSMDVEPFSAMLKAGESLARSDIGSPARQRELGFAVDLDQGTGMPGYVGKMSDVAWAQRVREYLVGIAPLAEPDLGLSDIDTQALDTTSLSYFTDDHDLIAVDGRSALSYERVFPSLCQLPSWEVGSAKALTIQPRAHLSRIEAPFLVAAWLHWRLRSSAVLSHTARNCLLSNSTPSPESVPMLNHSSRLLT